MNRTEPEDELDHLLRSLDDLEAELAAGDLAPDDYETLKADYTVRIADLMRGGGERSTGSGPARSRRWLLITVVVSVFALGAGLLLAASAGERGVGDALTGSINESPRQKTFRCRQLGVTGEMLASLECFDEVLTTDPENVEALTYRGWYLVLTLEAAGSIDGSDDEGRADTDGLLEAAAGYLDRAVEIDPTYPDARAFRAVVLERQGRGDAVCAEIATLLALEPGEFFVQQTAPLAARNGC